MATRLSAAQVPVVLSAADRHLVSRFSYGISEPVTRQVRWKKGGRGWFEWQLDPARIPDANADAIDGWYPTLRRTPSAQWDSVKNGSYSAWSYGHDLASATMARKVVSNRQVQEVMTDFWANLFHIPVGEDSSFPHRADYQRMLRKYSLTNFRYLLINAVQHPAMSGWLSNYDNHRAGINENLGRELLELYTVGRSAGYTETDVKNSARILTGFTVQVFNGYAAGYEPSRHWTGAVTVMGFRHANTSSDGRAVLRSYLTYLAQHPATAQRIARRLCRRFVADEPSQAIVDAVAKTFRSSKCDIKKTLRTLVAHKDFARSVGKKVRTPSESVINAARVMGVAPKKPVNRDTSLAYQMLWMSQQLGDYPMRWPRPDGAPEATTEAYATSARLVAGWKMHYSMAGNWWRSTSMSRASIKDQVPTKWPMTVKQLVDHQSRMLLGRPASSAAVDAIAHTIWKTPSSKIARASEIDEWHWVVVRGVLMADPEGVLR